MYHCNVCNYTANREDNLKRHFRSDRHILNNNIYLEELRKDNEEAKNETIIVKGTESKTPICMKCKKPYKTKKILQKHVFKCDGLDSKTCDVCMTTFSDTSNKFKHIKKNNCTPVTIFKYLHHKGILVTDNYFQFYSLSYIMKNKLDVYIKPFACERNDYVSDQVVKDLIKKSPSKSILNIIKLIHFNLDFPENHNIKYQNDNFYWKKRKDGIL